MRKQGEERFRCPECSIVIPRSNFSSHPQVCPDTEIQLSIKNTVMVQRDTMIEQQDGEIKHLKIAPKYLVTSVKSTDTFNHNDQLNEQIGNDIYMDQNDTESVLDNFEKIYESSELLEHNVDYFKQNELNKCKQWRDIYETIKVHGKEFICTTCDAKSTSSKKIRRHTDRNHKDLPCGECGQKLPWKSITCCEHKYRVCHFCFKIFEDNNKLKRHMTSHTPSKRHTQVYRNYTKEGDSFVCTICNTKCETRKRYYTHMARNHRDFPCTECGQKFPWNCDSCLRHTNRVCHICNKIFEHNIQLRTHMNRHFKLKPFICDQCPRKYVSNNELVYHFKWNHTSGEKKPPNKIPCGECGILRTKRYKNCSAHTMRHQNQRSHEDLPCEKGCGYTTRIRYYLKYHYLSKRCDPEKPLLKIFFCNFCESSFTTAKYKRKHEKFHKEGKPHKCKICEKLFTETWTMKKHVQKAHSGFVKPLQVE